MNIIVKKILCKNMNKCHQNFLKQWMFMDYKLIKLLNLKTNNKLKNNNQF